MTVQQHLFEIIKSKMSGNTNYSDEIGELLNISTSAAYRRINGKTSVTLDELIILCKQFNISMDEILNYNPEKSIFFQFVGATVQENYYTFYIERLYETLSYLRSANELYLTACDIPICHLSMFPDLLFFQLYTVNMSNMTNISYADFCEQLNKDNIIQTCKQITNLYTQIPSKEIWTTLTVNMILQSIEYYAETDGFADDKTILHLLEQLSKFIDTISKYADAGNKGHKEASFSLYLCPIEVDNNIMLIKTADKPICNIKLFTYNSVITDDISICFNTEKYINALISKSTLISESSARARSHFFHTLEKKINDLISKLKLSKHIGY
jgi:plasmid maintenance system antidote protein VapI